jgi:circadian clock protein KaiB
VTAWTPRSIVAYRNLRKICAEHLEDKCTIEVVDLLKHPECARQEQIVAVPTLVKLSPKPRRVLIGDFSNVERVLKGLDVELGHEVDGLAPIKEAQWRVQHG